MKEMCLFYLKIGFKITWAFLELQEMVGRQDLYQVLQVGPVFVEEGFRHTYAHEIGHTYGLCDEYDSNVWHDQDNVLFSTNLCPNGDSDNNGILDSTCLDNPKGCKTSTFKELITWTDLPSDDTHLDN